MKGMSPGTIAYVLLMWAFGMATCLLASTEWNPETFPQLCLYLAVTVASSNLKVRLPGISTCMSVNYVFILLSVTELSLLQTVTVAWAGTAAQSLLRFLSRPKPIQLTFNLCQITVCTALTWLAYHSQFLQSLDGSLAIMLSVAASIYFLLNTFSISGIIALTEERTLFRVWRENFFWTAPHYLIGAGLAAVIHVCNREFGWQYNVLVLPAVYLVYRSYHLYLGRLAEEKRHVEEVAGLHLRTIEALALAIEAKDSTTHSHLRRVQTYATEIAKDLGLNSEEIQALQAASLLHDIGKLAVPEYIISKPGKLTPDEFERMKVHPLVGAEILECVNFPYPVVPIVRSHHEKWDGSGYPDGLKGEEIPMAARILSAVDCLDALTSDRQYRRALPLDEAMAHVAREAGKSYDPRVVQVLQRRYLELEQMVKSSPPGNTRLSTQARVLKGAPAAGFELVHSLPDRGPEQVEMSFITAIAAARQEFQMLHEATRDLGTSLSIQETLAMLAERLKPMVPYDGIAIFRIKQGKLVPQYASGEGASLFSSLEIPMGQGLSGWVAENKRPIVNGNPSVECGYLADPRKFSNLRSALSVPLEGLSGVIGALTLYRKETDAFTRDNLRLLLAVNSKAALTIENALKYNHVHTKVGTDQLTGLLNTQSLFLHLDRELVRCKEAGSTLAVMVLDLDGFKEVNDRFGHLAGNKVLQLTGRGLTEVCRQTDCAARMGGDEFAVVISDIGPEIAKLKAFAFSKVVADAGRQVCGDDIVSASVGVAFFPADGQDAEQLLAEADRRMYVMKKEHHTHVRRAQEISRQQLAVMGSALVQ